MTEANLYSYSIIILSIIPTSLMIIIEAGKGKRDERSRKGLTVRWNISLT